jgi:hypothetical protein
MRTARWMGVAGATLLVAYLFWHSAEDAESISNSPYALTHMLGAISWLLMVIGMLGRAELIWQRAGRFGWISYLMAFAGSVLWVGLMFFDGFVNDVLVRYAPGAVHPGFAEMFRFYGPAFAAVALCLILFAGGYVGLAIAMTRHQLLSIPTATMLALSAVVFSSALLFHSIEPIMIERIAGLPFALGFILLMRSQDTARTAQRRSGAPPDHGDTLEGIAR